MRSEGRRSSSNRTVKNEGPGARRTEMTLMGGKPWEQVPGGREVLTISTDPFLRLLSRQQCWCPLSLSPSCPRAGTLPGTEWVYEFARAASVKPCRYLTNRNKPSHVLEARNPKSGGSRVSSFRGPCRRTCSRPLCSASPLSLHTIFPLCGSISPFYEDSSHIGLGPPQ